MRIWHLILLILLATSPSDAQADLSYWIRDFEAALASGDLQQIRPFFSESFADEEMATWKNSIESGDLNLADVTVQPLSADIILLHVPTNDDPYANETGDTYFDFIYRIFRLDRNNTGPVISGRCMDDINPDFVTCESKIDVRTEKGEFGVEATMTVLMNSDHLLFRLAKEFEIDELLIDGNSADYSRFGYIVHLKSTSADTVTLQITGSIHSPPGNNQFLSVDETNFFLRIGGFAALPSPPPANDGRYHFSKDETRFDLTYDYPDDFALVQYGDVYREKTADGRIVLSARSEGPWMDNIAFYAQNDWRVETITDGHAELGFYFPDRNGDEMRFVTSEVRELMDWSNSIFGAYPDPKINFVILNNFYVGGALNDSRSIITQDAETMIDDTYIHEILHLVPQPRVVGNYLWIKEGFTNFLSFDFIESRDPDRRFWQEQQRKYLHYFDLYEEPLIALTDTRAPTYWAAYQKGPWIYRMLGEVIGRDHFAEAMAEFARMGDQELTSIREYIEIFEQVSGQDLDWFEEQWLSRRGHPVVRVSSQYEFDGESGLVRIRATQENGVFRFPLDVAVDLETRTDLVTVWVDSASIEVTVPVDEMVTGVRYDPSARLFAVIKTDPRPFVAREAMVRSLETSAGRFRSTESGETIEFCLAEGDEGLRITSRRAGSSTYLDLSKDGCPVSFERDGEIIYAFDPDAMLIRFPDQSYHAGESVYPDVKRHLPSRIKATPTFPHLSPT